MKKRIFSAIIASVAAAALSVSAFATDPGATNGEASTTATVTDGSVALETDLGLAVEADEGTFDESVTSITLEAEVSAVSGTVSAVENAVASVASSASVTVNTKVSITLLDQNNVKIQPNGNVKVTLASDGVSNAVAYVSDDAKTVEFFKLTKNSDGTVSFETSHFSDYYLVTVDEASLDEVVAAGTVELSDGTGDTGSATEDKNQATGVVLAVIPAAVAAAAIVVSKKRK